MAAQPPRPPTASTRSRRSGTPSDRTLDVAVMAEVAGVLHVARLMHDRLGATAAEAGVKAGEGDVLLTLFRAGPPHRLSPTALATSTLVATGTMTNRLDKLEARALVRRLPNPDDRRGLAIELTSEGRDLADRLVVEHLASEHEMLAALGDRERAQLRAIMRTLLAHLERSER